MSASRIDAGPQSSKGLPVTSDAKWSKTDSRAGKIGCMVLLCGRLAAYDQKTLQPRRPLMSPIC
jgi:hypothetical protein